MDALLFLMFLGLVVFGAIVVGIYLLAALSMLLDFFKRPARDAPEEEEEEMPSERMERSMRAWARYGRRRA